MPGRPALRYRSAHRFAVVTEQFHRSAARRSVQPLSTTSWARRSRPAGVSWALAWDTKTSVVRCECLVASHLTRRSSSSSSRHAVPNVRGQYAWPVLIRWPV